MKITFCNQLIWLIKAEGRLERANALRKILHLSQYQLNDESVKVLQVIYKFKRNWILYSVNVANLVKVNRKEGLLMLFLLLLHLYGYIPLAVKGVKKDTSLKW